MISACMDMAGSQSLDREAVSLGTEENEMAAEAKRRG